MKVKNARDVYRLERQILKRRDSLVEIGISWKGNEGGEGRGGEGGWGVISLTTVDWRKGCWGASFIFSVCVCVWVFSGMRVSAN